MSTFGVARAPLFNHSGGEQIIQWRTLRGWSHKYQTVWVDVGKLEDNFQFDNGRRFSGLHGIDGKYEGVGQFVASGARLDMIDLFVRTKEGRRVVSIYDGRHRFAWMRDHGAKALPVAALIGDAYEVSKLIGSDARICRVTMQDGCLPVTGKTVSL